MSDQDILDILNVHQLERLVRHFNLADTAMRFGRFRFAMLRRKLTKHADRVGSEDVLLAEDGPASMSDPDLLLACLARGLAHGSGGGSGGAPSGAPSGDAGEVRHREELVQALDVWLLASVGKHMPVVLIAFRHLNTTEPFHETDDT